MEFWVGVIFGPFIWLTVIFLMKWVEDGVDWVSRKLGMSKWDKDQKRKYKLEKELEKLNERGH